MLKSAYRSENRPMNKLYESLFVAIQFLLPKRMLSRMVYRLARIRLGWLKNTFIRIFMRAYRIRLDEALITDINKFEDFNAFFTRELKPGSRTLGGPPERIFCPADGTISQAGRVDGQLVLQAKGRHYTLDALLGDPQLAAQFNHGCFATIYLAPFNYHRVHMPADGTLLSMRYIPGQLFSVNHTTANRVDNLFARNERIVCEFATATGPMTQILVGALNVGSMATVWAGDVTPRKKRCTDCQRYDDQPVQLARGAEMGRFNMGSTVIVLFGNGQVQLEPGMVAGSVVRVGQAMAHAGMPANTDTR